MSEFYKELKELRVERGIDLEEIHSRTKISVATLKAIEDGQFSQLPHTYIRLFVRAYALEIGADADDTLRRLERLLGNESGPLNEKNDLEEDTLDKPVENEEEITDSSISSRTAKNMHIDMVKGILLVSVLIFAIYIIREINEEEAANAPISYPSEFEEEGPITDQMLQNDYDVIVESVQMMEAEAPYSLKVATAEKVWYQTRTDNLSPSDDVLPSGDNRIYEFTDSLDILFKHSESLNLYLNGSALNSFDSSSNPIRITLSSVDKTVTIQRFAPRS